MKTKSTLSLSVLLVTLFSFVVSSCNHDNKAEEKQAYVIPDSLLRSLTMDTVKLVPYKNELILNGQVDFNQDKVINIFTPVTGKISEIKVLLGDYVQKGQVLGVIHSSEMSQLSSDLLNAQTNLQNAERVMTKTRDMYQAGLASQPDSLSAAIALQQAKAELVRVKRNLKINGNNTNGEYLLQSPISGFLVQKNVTNELNIRSDNSTPLFTISDLKEVWVWANAYESDINNIRPNDKVDVSLLASHKGEKFSGKVDKIMEILDPASKAMKVRISINNPQYILKPQMYAKVKILNNENQTAMSVPLSSVIFEHSQYFVLVYKGKGIAQITPVNKINSFENEVYVSGDIKPGDKVLSSNVLQIYSELNN
jgi:membrane fusion protein, heavy metal efflux system